MEFLPNATSIQKRTYKLADKYKDIIKKEIENMLVAGISYSVDKLEWASPMEVQPKKHDPKKIHVCVEFIWINRVTLTYHFPAPFANENINEVAGHDCYSFTDGLFGYNQVPIAKEDQAKTTFVCEFGYFAYKVMPFGLKNALAFSSRIVIKAF